MVRALITLLCLLWSVTTATAATYYASQTGTGTGASTGSPFQISDFWAVANPGDILRLMDGIYTGANSMIDPPSTVPNNLNGTSGSRITIQAINDGKVLINGQGARIPLRLENNDYFTIEGVNACCSSGIVLLNGQSADNNIFQRIVMWDANDPNGESIINIWGSSGTQLIDIAAWGRGRKVLGRVNDSNTTVLRGFFMGRKRTIGGYAVSYSYKSSNALNANVIATEDLDAGSPPGPYVFGGDHYNLVYSGTYTLRILGSIVYHVDGQNIPTPTGSRLMRRSFNPGNVEDTAVVTTISRNNLTMRRTTAVPSLGYDCPEQLPKVDCDQSDWTDSLGSVTGGTHTTENGAQAIGSFNNGLLQLGATSQPANGAWLRYSYNTAGTIDTGTPLWPWPMNQRIKDALVSSGYGARGLDGKGATDLTALMMSLTGSVLGGTGSALHLTFETQPQTTQEDAVIPGFRACVFDSANVKQLTHTANILITLQSNPGGSTLGGAVAVTPVSGCSTWNSVTINNPGVGYTLRATSAGVTGTADTNAFTITAAPVAPPTPPTPPPTAQKVRIIPKP